MLFVANQHIVEASLREVFHNRGYLIWETEEFEEAIRLAERLDLKAIVIDLDLSIDGLELCKHLRRDLKLLAPIVLLSSDQDELTCTLGLELGADDFVIKPFRVKELLARIKAILRRSSHDYLQNNNSQKKHDPKSKSLTNGGLTIDPANYTLYNDKQLIELTRKEFELLHYLFLNKGKVLEREELAKALSSQSHTTDDRIIDVFISRLRQKLESERRKPHYIKTIRGRGYLFINHDKQAL
ncbi:two-component system, OmpR family, alkaline phosphatase synthesis response regulator PhoP [Amphibacillus marinus]|uniref:Two-component system, OmpR family, alkaline phosphatase synthesis response regulator PhoP n=1 Tax=Amphibacillus marinus TaxID=872970 RepID=A0A1H8S1U4_9BACI|nr:two-component system, OmpR family, alkaline phosphatase synthesis response regulator PhoP [Amphibacillus marinus]